MKVDIPSEEDILNEHIKTIYITNCIMSGDNFCFKGAKESDTFRIHEAMPYAFLDNPISFGKKFLNPMIMIFSLSTFGEK